jgi:hypothetical protein
MVMPADRGGTTWILSNGRIRIVTEAEAERFWRESARR